MLIGNRAKYLGIILGIAFAALLIAQQSSIFCGLMALTTSQIKDVHGVEIWVMDKNVEFIDDIKPLSDNDLWRVRGVSGVKWAVPFYKGLARARMADGQFQQVILLGLDDATLVGAPVEMIVGEIKDLERPDALIIDDAGYQQLWPDEPFTVGKVFEMNDRRGVLVGVCKASRTFQTFPIVYTRYSKAIQFVPSERKTLSFVLAEGQSGLSSEDVCCTNSRADRAVGVDSRAIHVEDDCLLPFANRHPGQFWNHGVAGLCSRHGDRRADVLPVYRREHQAVWRLKAMGTSNARIVGMVLLQAMQVGAIGYGLGVGGAAAFGELTKVNSKLAFYMPWWVLAITAVAVMAIIVLSSLVSIRKVLVVEPAIVFKG